MIEIVEAPDVPACSSCMSPLVWLYSYRTGRTFSVVSTGPKSFDLHECRHAQDSATWRHIRQGSPPTGDYLEARNKIAPKETNA